MPTNADLLPLSALIPTTPKTISKETGQCLPRGPQRRQSGLKEVSSPSESKLRLMRAGCYNCRVRKVSPRVSPRDADKLNHQVKCTRPDSDSRGMNDSRTPCQNCSRLRFECRWTAPRPGEDFTPPPKRRRTLHRDRERESHSAQGEEAGGPVADGQAVVNGIGNESGMSDFGLPSNEAGPSSDSSALPPSNGATTDDFNTLWGDLFDLGDLPTIPMDWNQALDIVLPQRNITEIPDLSPYSQLPILEQSMVSAPCFEVPTLDWTAENHPHLIRHYLEVNLVSFRR